VVFRVYDKMVKNKACDAMRMYLVEVLHSLL